MIRSKANLIKLNSGTGFRLSFVAFIIVILGLAFTTIIPVAQAGPTAQTEQDGSSVLDGLGLTLINEDIAQPKIHENHAPVCPGPSKDAASCYARVITDSKGNPQATVMPSGYGPAQFRGAYGLSGSTSANQIIAIVDAYDHPNILSDLNTYSAQFGIPTLESCAVSSGNLASPCFQKVDQRGGTAYPRVNPGWALEIALDVEVAHAICQNCNILLVEADSNSYTDLMAAFDRARLMGATVISNSY